MCDFGRGEDSFLLLLSHLDFFSTNKQKGFLSCGYQVAKECVIFRRRGYNGIRQPFEKIVQHVQLNSWCAPLPGTSVLLFIASEIASSSIMPMPRLRPWPPVELINRKREVSARQPAGKACMLNIELEAHIPPPLQIHKTRWETH